MRCRKCGKNFDGEIYSGICPKCGHFNNRQAEIDVSEYFSAKFEDGENASADMQIERQHAKLHDMYDAHSAHKAGAGQHEKLHEMYDGQKHAAEGQHEKLHEMYDGQKHAAEKQHAKLHDRYDEYNSHRNRKEKASRSQGRNDWRNGEEKQSGSVKVVFRIIATFLIVLVLIGSVLNGDIGTAVLIIVVWLFILRKKFREI